MITNSLRVHLQSSWTMGLFHIAQVDSSVFSLSSSVFDSVSEKAMIWQRWAVGRRKPPSPPGCLITSQSRWGNVQPQWSAWTSGSQRSFIQQSHSWGETPWSLQTQENKTTSRSHSPWAISAIAKATSPSHFPDTAHPQSLCHSRILSRTSDRYFQSPPRLLSKTSGNWNSTSLKKKNY